VKTTRLTTGAGMLWACACFIMLLMLFFGFAQWEKAFAALPFTKINDKYTGGPVWSTIEHGAYRAVIHQPVFPALLGQASKGFVQVNWRPLTNLPLVISEDIACSAGGRPDFSITINTSSGHTTVTPLRDGVLPLQTSCALSDSWVVRVALERKKAPSGGVH